MAHALVSGGSSGIGLALSKILAGEGWNLTILARDKARLEEAKAILNGARKADTQQVIAVSADVADPIALDRSVGDAVAQLGAPDLLVARAGIVISSVPAFRRCVPTAKGRSFLCLRGLA